MNSPFWRKIFAEVRMILTLLLAFAVVVFAMIYLAIQFFRVI